MNPDEYATFDGTGLARLVRAGQVCPSELLDAALKQLERRNPALNAVTSVLTSHGRDAITSGLPAGPLHGVPYLLKDLGQQQAGTITSGACRVLLGRPAACDSTLVSRLRSGGLVIFGKTNTPELGLSVTTESAMFGPASNSWDTGRTTGGSSGGAAGAVAGGIVPMAQASDSGGSIRVPASCCGLVGLKPTRGRNPLGPDLFEGMAGAATVHAVTRSVRDCAALLDITAGGEPGDPYLCYPHQGTFSEQVRQDPGHLRIAVMTEPYPDAAVDADVRAALAQTTVLLGSLGYHLGEARPALDGAALLDSMPVVFGAHVSALLDGAAASRGRPWDAAEVEPFTLGLVRLARLSGADAYAAAVQSYQRAARVAAAFYEDWDLLLSPTLATTPVLLGTLPSGPGASVTEVWRAFLRFSPFAPIANLTGQPAISLPLARSPSGLPIGMTFTAALGREDTLLRLAGPLEAASPWPTYAGAAGPRAGED